MHGLDFINYSANYNSGNINRFAWSIWGKGNQKFPFLEGLFLPQNAKQNPSL